MSTGQHALQQIDRRLSMSFCALLLFFCPGLVVLNGNQQKNLRTGRDELLGVVLMLEYCWKMASIESWRLTNIRKCNRFLRLLGWMRCDMAEWICDHCDTAMPGFYQRCSALSTDEVSWVSFCNAIPMCFSWDAADYSQKFPLKLLPSVMVSLWQVQVSKYLKVSQKFLKYLRVLFNTFP